MKHFSLKQNDKKSNTEIADIMRRENMFSYWQKYVQ